MKTLRLFTLPATVCAAFALSGCGLFSSVFTPDAPITTGTTTKPNATPKPMTKPNATPKPTPNANGLIFSAHTDKTAYKRDEPVKITMTLHNAGSKATTVDFSSGQEFDIAVYAAADTKNTVWSWSMDKMFSMALRHEVLDPGETRAYSAQWEQKSNGATALSDGKYFVDAQLANMPQRLSAARLTIHLDNASE